MRLSGMMTGVALALALPAAARAETACADLAKVALPHAEVTKAALDGDVCKVAVTSRPTADSDIRVELWIPRGAAWNGKFVQVGNGGFAGTIPTTQLVRLSKAGYAVAGTDDGHQDPVGTSASWALGHSEKIVDYGWRAVKETTDISKALIAALSGGKPKTSYFAGCSDGGREALMTAQRYPNDFDGIIAGAPANYMSQLFGIGVGQHQALAAPGGYLGATQRELLQTTVLAQCGGEAFIRDPAACHFDPGKLLCKPGATTGCLTAPQLASARAIYDGRYSLKTGKLAFPGYSPGAEAVGGSWDAWITGPAEAFHSRAAGYQFSSNALKYFAFQNPDFDFLKMSRGDELESALARMGVIIDAPDPNLAAFKAHGGKLIQYHGWNDPAIPARSSIRYYEDVRRTMGDTGGFYRLYLIPGMLHCSNGPGPNTVDWVAALDAWVVGKTAPAAVTATGKGDERQLLCPYPAVAKKTGEAWACRAPPKAKG